jgi:2-polyprenyl-6-methoxyphenol hydroxylase-like FAD-dependent oxidoreductase
MAPIGGVGINLAIQDAVAAANLLAGPLRAGPLGEGPLRDEHLEAVQARRWWPTRVTQGLQVLVQERLISRVLEEQDQLPMPLAMRALRCLPVLRRLPARVIGLGVRPEHVETRAVEV